MTTINETIEARVARRIALVEENLHLASVGSSLPGSYAGVSNVMFVLGDVRALLARGDAFDAARRIEHAAAYVWAFGNRPEGW